MMDVEREFDALVARARQERPPRVNVAGRVLAILSESAGQYVPRSERPLMWVAALSSAVAVPAAVFAIVANMIWVNPLIEILDEISWVMP